MFPHLPALEDGRLNPLDLERLAFRIESLQRQSTHDWCSGDELEFRNQLPEGQKGDTRTRLPHPQKLREAALSLRMTGRQDVLDSRNYMFALQRCLRMESLVHQNRPLNRMVRNIMRGRFPR